MLSVRRAAVPGAVCSCAVGDDVVVGTDCGDVYWLDADGATGATTSAFAWCTSPVAELLDTGASSVLAVGANAQLVALRRTGATCRATYAGSVPLVAPACERGADQVTSAAARDGVVVVGTARGGVVAADMAALSLRSAVQCTAAITALAFASDGALWIGTASQLLRCAGVLQPPVVVHHGTVLGLAPAGNGSVVVAHRGGFDVTDGGGTLRGLHRFAQRDAECVLTAAAETDVSDEAVLAAAPGALAVVVPTLQPQGFEGDWAYDASDDGGVVPPGVVGVHLVASDAMLLVVAE